MITLAEITLSADLACSGMYIRWYFNGWHYAIARLGEESLTTTGGYATTTARGALKLETEQGDALDTYALQSMAYAPSLQVYTSEGWTNAMLDSGRFRTYEEGVDKLRHELSITLFGRRGSTSPIVVPAEPTDLDYLRAIREANPDSLLPDIWNDENDPFTDWWDDSTKRGALFGRDPRLDSYAVYDNFSVPPIGARRPEQVYALSLYGCNITTLPNISKLDKLCAFISYYNNISAILMDGMPLLNKLTCNASYVETLSLQGTNNLATLACTDNLLEGIPTLTAKGGITEYYFMNNRFSTAELDRLRVLGFTDDSRLLPQNP